ncbi:hypothetical protein NH288_04685 [Anaerococcus sp. NML200537]|uniref:hypothetical protein n=1 Tax=Anaerococcus sp. NML200537 TaxID=2954485 RepID=UPI002238279F|nr:hypothetical protein [Anaerococcus sp. NML200537]MCW6701379.1 hypothetical protein [Anaerococcus sp. NML200537]
MAFKKGYQFHNIRHRKPGVYSNVVSDMRIYKANGAKNIALIGTSKGGVPGEVKIIEDPEDAQKVLKGGNLLDAALKAYDPVVETKDGVRLGGADQIFCIRSNSASKSTGNVYQTKTVDAKIGEVIVTKHANTTGKVTASGTYTGDVNKTYKIEITSPGIKDLAEASYIYYLASDGEQIGEELPLKNTSNATDKELGDGVKVTFAEGKYNQGDTFLIPCTAKVTESEFVYTITSKDYGEENNLISHKLTDGASPKTKCLTIYDAKKDSYEQFDNLGGAFSIKYNGEQAYASLSIVSNGKGDAIKLQTYIGDNAESAKVDIDLDLDPTQFSNVRSLSLFLMGYKGYEVEPVKTVNSELSVHDLDFYDKVEIKEKTPITAVLRDIKKTTKTQSNLVEVTIINREVSNYADYSFQPLSGGAEGREARSFIKFLDELSKYDIDYIVPLTDDIGIIAECREHVIKMSERYGKERRLVCGGANNMSVEEQINQKAQLEHERVQFTGQGFYDYNNKLYPAYIHAAMYAGRFAFLGVESATADVFKYLKPENTYSEEDKSKLIDNGILFDDMVAGRDNQFTFYPKLVWDYTTFAQYNDPLKIERSTGAIADQLSKDIRKALDKMLTGKLTPFSTLESARNRAISVLQQYKKDGIIVAYRDVRIDKKNDRVYLTFDVAPTEVTNFVFIDVKFYAEELSINEMER